MGGGPPGFGLSFTCSVLLGIPLGRAWDSGTGPSPSSAGLSRPFPFPCAVPHCGPATPGGKPPGLGSSAFARHYLRNHGCFLFLRVLRCFTSPGVAPQPYEFRLQRSDMTRSRFPRSEIPGSKRACRSPGLIAACHVLHRLPMPRHPSCALARLTNSIMVLST